MKVLFIIDSLVEAGAEKSTVEIAKNLRNFTPVFVSIYSEDFLQKDLENAGIKVYSLNTQQKYGFNKILKKLNSIYEIEKPNIVHSVLYRADLVARKMKKKYPHIPLVGSFVNNSYTSLRYKDQSFFMKLKLWIAYRLDKASSKKVDFFISNSETIKISEGGALGISPDKVEVIYRGRDLNKFQIAQENVNKLKQSLNVEAKNILVNVSRLIKRKGQIDIIRSIPEVIKKFPETVLLIVGNGDYKKILQEEISRLNLKEHIILLGKRNDVAELLAVADVFIYSSYAEGLPGALIEAMMSRNLIITSDIKENMECIDKESALIYKTGDVVELSQKIIYAIQNKDELKHLGVEAKKQAAERFNLISIAQKYENVYRQLILKNINA